LKWSLEWGPHLGNLEAAGVLDEDEDGDEPSFWKDQPLLPEHLLWVWQAFRELSTDRAFSTTLGPIPRQAITDFARFHGIAGDEFAYLTELIRRMDDVYIEYQADRSKKS
jgi:hypothetical protein